MDIDKILKTAYENRYKSQNYYDSILYNTFSVVLSEAMEEAFKLGQGLQSSVSDSLPDVPRHVSRCAERGEPAHGSALARHDSADQVSPLPIAENFVCWLEDYPPKILSQLILREGIRKIYESFYTPKQNIEGEYGV